MKWIKQIFAFLKEWDKKHQFIPEEDFSQVDNYATDEDAPYFTDGQ